MKITKAKLVRSVILVCIALFLIYNLYLLNEQTLRGNALPMPFGFGTAIVLSGSMEPTLRVDDLILVAQQDNYQVGDVVVYQSENSLVVHRIIAMEGSAVTTQGDANNAPDSPVELALVKGKVVGRVENAGRVLRLLKSPVVAFGLMALAIYLLESSFRKEKEKENDEISKLEAEIQRLKQVREE